MTPDFRISRLHICMLAMMAVMAACSSIDCPLNNAVYSNYKLMGPVAPLPDVLTISAARPGKPDTVLLNQQQNTDSFMLPMSFAQEEDVLYFKANQTIDTVWVKKENHPHFESVDCGPNYFHTITGVRFTRHAIDSVVIHQKEVTYDVSPKHFYIYFKEYRF